MAFDKRRKTKSIRFSQNFLVNPSLVRMLIKKARITASDTVIEIGPGYGIITRELAKFAGKVIAVEKDKKMAIESRKAVAPLGNVSVIHEDFLNFQIKHPQFKIFSNPPFSVSTKIIKRVVQMPRPPLETYLVMQHEAAKRFASMNQEYLFSVQSRPWFTFRVVHSFKPTDFKPAPGVRTVLFKISLNKNPRISLSERKRYIRFTAAGITGKAPTLRKNLHGLITPTQWKRFVASHELESDLGPLELTVDQWVDLYTITTV